MCNTAVTGIRTAAMELAQGGAGGERGRGAGGGFVIGVTARPGRGQLADSDGAGVAPTNSHHVPAVAAILCCLAGFLQTGVSADLRAEKNR